MCVCVCVCARLAVHVCTSVCEHNHTHLDRHIRILGTLDVITLMSSHMKWSIFTHHPLIQQIQDSNGAKSESAHAGWLLITWLPSKVTELQDARLRIKEEVLGLDVSMTHSIGVDVRQRSEQLVHIELYTPGKEGGGGATVALHQCYHMTYHMIYHLNHMIDQ